MTDLRQSLIKSEFSYLKAVAEKWKLPFSAPDARQGVEQLVESLLVPDLLSHARDLLSPPEIEALIWLDDRGGREIWDHFQRRFGEIREMGAGRLDRERPDLDPISPVENLWYRALIARGFFETGEGLKEFAYIPEDLRGAVLPLLNPGREQTSSQRFLCRKAALREMAAQHPAATSILDHICTLLAGFRMGEDPAEHLPEVAEVEKTFYQQILVTAGMLDEKFITRPENTRRYYELEKAEALLFLWQAWLKSSHHQDHKMVPGIEIEGVPELDPIPIRQHVIKPLQDLDPQEWWSIESFISQIRERDPDFLRSAGEYEAMFIKDTSSGEFLTGFSSWELIEGKLIRYILTGPLHWLGAIDLGCPDEGSSPLSFRVGKYFSDFIGGAAPHLPPIKTNPIQIRSKGEIRVTRDVPHRIRYQIARFCGWGPYKADAYYYFLTPGSLAGAEAQGLKVAHLLSLLKKHTEAIPPNILSALERWHRGGVQVSISQRTIMRLGSPAVLKALKRSPAARFIQEQLGPTVVIIKAGSEEKVAQALVELGFFTEIEDQPGSQT